MHYEPGQGLLHQRESLLPLCKAEVDVTTLCRLVGAPGRRCQTAFKKLVNVCLQLGDVQSGRLSSSMSMRPGGRLVGWGANWESRVKNCEVIPGEGIGDCIVLSRYVCCPQLYFMMGRKKM